MDAEGNPIPAKGAQPEEHLALCEVVGRYPGTMLSGIFQGGSTGWSDFELDHLSRMSAVANRVLNWNLLVVDAEFPERVVQQLSLSEHARTMGGRIVALMMPTIVPMTMSFGNYCALFLIPGWREIMSLPPAERMQALRSSDNRRALDQAANSEAAGMFRALGNFAGYRIGDTHSAANEGLSGRLVGDIAQERGVRPFDALLDIVIDDDLRTTLWPPPAGDDDEHWAIRASVWERRRRAHGRLRRRRASRPHVRRRRTRPSSSPSACGAASSCRSSRRSTTSPTSRRGCSACATGAASPKARSPISCVFDPATVGAEPARLVHDLPGGAVRLVAGSTGVQRVFVNGVETIRDGESTGATPGTVLRSGRDTDTVTAR